MKVKRIILLSSMLIFLSLEIISQNISIRGNVSDNLGESLVGVTVVVENDEGHGTVTDINGDYVLENVSSNAVLIFSYVGMKRLLEPVNGRKVINVVLTSDAELLDEVVVVGYGTQKKINLTGSVDVVDGKQLINRSSSNVSLLLQGASPNLNISLSNMGGEPGATQKWQIRGIGSLSGSTTPLILVDGVEMDPNLLDPESIENVSVLKDASASAIYGSRAAFGVVLITTKRGQKDRPVQIQYSNNLAFAIPIYVPSMYDSYTYAIAFNQARANAGLGPTFSDEQVKRIKGYIDGTYPYEYDPENPPFNMARGRWDGNANNNWTKMYFKDFSFQQKHNISLNGNSDNMQYYLNAGVYDQPGLYTWGNDRFNRTNILSNISSKVTNWAKVDFGTKYAFTKQDNPIGVFGRPRTYTWGEIIDYWPTMPVKNLDGTYNNPLIPALLEGGRVKDETNDLWLNFGVEIEPIKGLKTNIRYNYNYQSHSQTQDPKPVIVHAPNGNTGNIGNPTTGAVSDLSYSKYNQFSLFSSYEKLLENHFFSGLIGYEWDFNYYKSLSGSKMDLITPQIVAIRAALGAITLDDRISHWATQGIFGRINYNYKEKYLVEFSARNDGSSKFARGSRWGFFPSFSAGYNIAKEDFWNPIGNYINTLKLRLSYGSLGNQNVANYMYLSTIPVSLQYDPSNTGNPGYIIDNEIPIIAKAPNIISSDLTWETVTTMDLGFDIASFNNRLNIVFDWYDRITKDMLGPSEQLPSVLGANAPKRNNSTLSTKGFELLIGWKDIISSDLSYNVSVGLSDYKTIIKEYTNVNGSINTWYSGKIYGDIWGLTTDGIIQSDNESIPDQSYYHANWGPGDIKYKDLNRDGKINPGNHTLDNYGDLSVIANTTPRYSYYMKGEIKWKNFDLNMFWHGIGKREVVPPRTQEYFWGLMANPNNSAIFKNGYMLDYWRPSDETNILRPNTDSFFPKPYFSIERNKNTEIQSKYVLNAAFIRLKNLQIGYSIPENLLNKIYLRNARVYVSGENLLTLSPLPKLFEPETTASSNSTDGGISLGEIYPISKMLSLGVNIVF